MQQLYMDHSATTPVAPEVIALMTEVMKYGWGNPSSQHFYGNEARQILNRARKQTAELIGANDNEITFTSGGTEADNLAIIGTALALQSRGRHLIMSAIEHHAVLHAFHYLEKNGFEVTVLPVDAFAQVNVEQLKQAIRKDTILISVMHANNEVGSLQPLAEIGEIARGAGIVFHSDAVQSVGRMPVNVRDLKVDLLSLSAHKFYGPKGIGALYVRKGMNLTPLMLGGGQEKGMRSGTENLPGIAGLGLAAQMAREEMPVRLERMQQLAEYLILRIVKEIPRSYITGHPRQRIPGHASFVFGSVDGTALLTFLDEKGIAASGAAACSHDSFQASHVLKAMGMKEELAHSALRLSLGKDNTREEVDHLMEILPGIIEQQRLLWSLQ
ncbi:MAG: cysteine desulfurase [Syntrophomonadaceae bacterium]|nr:cysteine desulfurase [Syntrophomonadaceae bacterium]